VVVSSELSVITLSWEDAYSHIVKLCEKIIESSWNPDMILAIARGGLVPAIVASDILNVKDVLVIQLEHWPSPGSTLPEVKIRHDIPSEDLSGRKILIIDDVADTGDTLKFAKDMICQRFRDVNVKTAAIHVKKGKAKYIPDYWAVEVDPKYWILYPWSCVEDVTALLERYVGNCSSIPEALAKLSRELNLDLTKIPAVCIKHALARLLK